jgi:malonate-semialdehyde dehydrogenase (acetylating)/methylmalonate-semialdehyde dehydrogenase
MVYTVPHYIDGTHFQHPHEATLPIHNPALGECIGQVPIASLATCQKAIESAKKAWDTWSTTPPVKRTHILFRFRELLEQHQLELAKLVTREHGKTLDDAKGSVARAIELVELHCGLINQLQGSLSMNVANQVDCYTIRQPLGICFGVSPFNFPVMVPIWMAIPAIAAGNVFILKPSEQDPSAAIRLMELLTEAGLPKGVVNVVQGDKSTVEYFLTHPDVRTCTAVASTPVAETIYQTAIAHGKRAHTFGGAKNHCVVMPDADIDYAAQAIVGAAYGAAGERCMAISVAVVVGDETATRLLQTMKPLIQKIKIDAGDTAGVDMGPLVSQAHRFRVLTAISQGVDEGADLVIDGREFKHPNAANGYFLGPCLFDNVNPSMSVYQQEIFGPVLVLLRVDNFEQALQLVNEHQYGNGTAIFTRDGYYAREYVQRVRVGMVGINIPIPVPITSHPFGGWKRSAFGDVGMHGLDSLHFYTQSKTITSKWPANSFEASGFAMPNHREGDNP